MMQTVLDNMSDGVMLFDKDMRWQFANRQLMDFQRFTPEIADPGVSASPILRFQAQRGDFGPIAEAEIEPRSERRRRRHARGRALRAPHRERQISSSSTSSRWTTAACSRVYRDITELKDREEALAAAKEAAEAARDDVERTRQIMQTVLDNMIGGVMLFDKDFRLQFVNRQVMEFQNYPPDVVKPGISGLRHPALPGEARRLRPGQGYRERRCASASP